MFPSLHTVFPADITQYYANADMYIVSSKHRMPPTIMTNDTQDDRSGFSYNLSNLNILLKYHSHEVSKPLVSKFMAHNKGYPLTRGRTRVFGIN